MLQRSPGRHPVPLAAFEAAAVKVASNDPRLCGNVTQRWDSTPSFQPHFGWGGHI
ncbi:MAG: hypothetical protein MUC88_21525 [Planctomycetes bacterium]|nr:hypothetical protein [Planctomycetota bacterium]